MDLYLTHLYMAKAVFDSLAAGKLDYGVVPQENSIFGSVIETYDSLRCAVGTFVRGETSLRIDHCLLARKGVALGDVKTVLSHEQVRICPGRSDLSVKGLIAFAVVGTRPMQRVC